MSICRHMSKISWYQFYNGGMFAIKRVYEPAEHTDGYRVLVDRLWPRGMSKERAAIDWWDKDIAPSAELRKWFAHRADRFEEFSRQYIEELDAHPGAVRALLQAEHEHGAVTLVYAAKDPHINHVRVLLDYLQQASAV